MNLVEVEAFTGLTNDAVLRVPGRRFPGVLVQGDSLNHLRQLARELAARAAKTKDEDFLAASKELVGLLDEKLRHYEAALRAHGVELPYR